MTADDAAVLRRALDQLAGLLDEVPPDALGRRTPCADWTLEQLVDHVVAAPGKFARMARGESVDWSQPTPSAGHDPAARFRSEADELLGAWGGSEGDGPVSLDWMCSELAVHAWDLATALDRPTGDLDPEVAERGLAFMQANLTEDNRSPAFGPERTAPEDGDAYRRAAAFAVRSV
jgi:uncharacterized protein (TIGR03086 family)